MQLSAVALLVIVGLAVGSLAVIALSVIGIAFSISLANRHEAEHLAQHHGPAWVAYRRHARAWWPCWRPRFASDGILYVDVDCSECNRIGRWFARRSVQLHVEACTPDMERITYVGPDGVHATGVAGVARALEHVNFGWSLAAWGLRLPGIAALAQVVADAVGAGPRRRNSNSRAGTRDCGASVTLPD